MSFVYHNDSAIGKILILGVGNILLEDEGVGVHVAHALQEMPLPDSVLVIDGGTSPDIPYLVDEQLAHCKHIGSSKGVVDKLIVIDAVKGGGEAGSIYRFAPDDIRVATETLWSAHHMDLLESLRMLALEVKPKEIVIIGIEPKEVGWGLKLSPEIKGKMPIIIETLLRETRGGNSNVGL